MTTNGAGPESSENRVPVWMWLRDYIQRAYTRVVYEDEVYVADVFEGTWERLTPKAVARLVKENTALAHPRDYRAVVDWFKINVHAMTKVGAMDKVRLFKIDGTWCDFESKRTYTVEESLNNYTVRREWELHLSEEPATIKLDRSSPSMNAWDWAVARYGIEFLQCFAVALFGQRHKQMPLGYSAISDYGKTVFVESLMGAMPGMIAELGTRAITEQGMKFSSIEVGQENAALVVIDEAHQKPVAPSLLNNLTSGIITVEIKGEQSYQTQRAGNVLFMASGPPKVDFKEQGISTRLGKLFEFPGNAPIDRYIGTQVIAAGPYLAYKLKELAWEVDHFKVMDGRTTAKYKELANTMSSGDPLEDDILDVVIEAKGVQAYSATDVFEWLQEAFPDEYAGLKYDQIGQKIGKVLTKRFGKTIRTRAPDGSRPKVYHGLQRRVMSDEPQAEPELENNTPISLIPPI